MPDKMRIGPGLQGLTRLIADATIGITNVVEDMHRQIVHPPFLPSTPVQNLITAVAGVTYDNIRWSTQHIGKGLDFALGKLEPLLGEIMPNEESDAIRAVLNGVAGDYLEDNANPLQIRMQFRYQSKGVKIMPDHIGAAYPDVNGKILLMLHGSCMNDSQWTRNGHNHGVALAQSSGYTPIYLYYNSGRHISTNGQDLNALLEALVKHWPVPVEEMTIIAHSMGGLLARSALYYGQLKQINWPKQVGKIVFLGTPHHGAPLERIGNYLDLVLESVPYARPFARLARIRSAGVTDLRYGNIIDEDWQGLDRFDLQGDMRHHIPLPQGIACYSIAAALGKEGGTASSRMFGDSLVDVKSVLGHHKSPQKELNFPKDHTWIAYAHNHLDLLSSPQVYKKIHEWIT